MAGKNVPISVASEHSGVKAPTIRYYEQIGLLPKPVRTNSNRRRYEPADLRRLIFIRHAREMGFEIDAIRALLTIQDDPDQSCEAVDAIARARLGEVERRIESLLKLNAELEGMLVDCGSFQRAGCGMPHHRGASQPQSLARVSLIIGEVHFPTDRPRQTELFPGFLGRDLLSRRGDAEILKLLARLQRRCKPSWFQSASCPGLDRVLRVAVFRSNSASGTTTTSFYFQSA
jgi:DNA-binding transcriptional MerR regulator